MAMPDFFEIFESEWDAQEIGSSPTPPSPSSTSAARASVSTLDYVPLCCPWISEFPDYQSSVYTNRSDSSIAAGYERHNDLWSYEPLSSSRDGDDESSERGHARHILKRSTNKINMGHGNGLIGEGRERWWAKSGTVVNFDGGECWLGGRLGDMARDSLDLPRLQSIRRRTHSLGRSSPRMRGWWKGVRKMFTKVLEACEGRR